MSAGSGTVRRMNDREAIVKAITVVTRKWHDQRRAEERSAAQELRRRDRLARSDKMDLKQAARVVMESAYLEASSDNTLPAKARQIRYKARPKILELTGGSIWSRSSYFTQTLLPDFVEANPDLTQDWNVIYDARGHLVEPHTGRRVPIGTLEVRAYLKAMEDALAGVREPAFELPVRFPICGPRHRFSALVYIEKEGFDELFEAVQLRERYGIATMSNKGMSVTAARELAEAICSEYGLPLLVLHDFDKSGFSILGTLQRDTRRFRWTRAIEVIDLGVRLEDVWANQLTSEPVHFGKPKKDNYGQTKPARDPRENLALNGATRRSWRSSSPAAARTRATRGNGGN